MRPSLPPTHTFESLKSTARTAVAAAPPGVGGLADASAVSSGAAAGLESESGATAAPKSPPKRARAGGEPGGERDRDVECELAEKTGERSGVSEKGGSSSGNNGVVEASLDQLWDDSASRRAIQ